MKVRGSQHRTWSLKDSATLPALSMTYVCLSRQQTQHVAFDAKGFPQEVALVCQKGEVESLGLQRVRGQVKRRCHPDEKKLAATSWDKPSCQALTLAKPLLASTLSELIPNTSAPASLNLPYESRNAHASLVHPGVAAWRCKCATDDQWSGGLLPVTIRDTRRASNA